MFSENNIIFEIYLSLIEAKNITIMTNTFFFWDKLKYLKLSTSDTK